MTDITDFSDSEITAYIAHHESELRKFKDEQQRREAEIARRRLAEYWQAHPEMTPVNVGDKLLITEAFHQLKVKQLGREASYDLMNDWQLGNSCTVRDIQFNTSRGHVGVDGEWSTSCTLDVMVDMRRAWIERENAGENSKNEL